MKYDSARGAAGRGPATAPGPRPGGCAAKWRQPSVHWVPAYSDLLLASQHSCQLLRGTAPTHSQLFNLGRAGAGPAAMAAQTSPLHPLTGGDRGDLTVEDDGDPPQLPVMVPSVATVTSMASTGQTSANVTSSEIPAVVSITRVPAKPKQQEVPSGGGLKVRTDLGAPTQKPGPPPLLRVAGGPSPRPSLPPMPKLKLGGQRTTGPSNLRFQPPIQVPANPLNGVMINKTHQSQGNVTSQQTKVGAMPIITNSMSLRQLRPKPPQVPSLNPRFGNSPASRGPAPRQMATFIPQSSSTATTPPLTPTTRPVQVRTVFVPPPMKMKSPAPSPVSPSANTAGGTKKMNTFNLGIPASVPLATGISITPISKSNGLGKMFHLSNIFLLLLYHFEISKYFKFQLQL